MLNICCTGHEADERRHGYVNVLVTLRMFVQQTSVGGAATVVSAALAIAQLQLPYVVP